MQRYVVRRLTQSVVSLFILVVVVFILGRALGDPVAMMLPVDAPAELVEQMRAQWGLDRPYPEQFFRFAIRLARGDFGESLLYKIPALQLFLERLPNSLAIIIPAFGLAFILGIPLGVVAAIRRGGFFDTLCTFIAAFFMAAPRFWLGLMLIYLFSVTLGVLPAARMGGPSHYILPVVTQAGLLVAGITRLIRSGMLEALDSEYAKLARIKGVSEWAVTLQHCLRNSLITTFSFAGTYLAILITGAIVVEVVFAWPGVGRLIYDAIIARDYPLIQAIITLKALMILALNLVIDILYAYVDPRIRY